MESVVNSAGSVNARINVALYSKEKSFGAVSVRPICLFRAIALSVLIVGLSAQTHGDDLQWFGWCQFAGKTLSGPDPMALINECVAACDAKTKAYYSSYKSCELVEISEQSSVITSGFGAGTLRRVIFVDTKYIYDSGEETPPTNSYAVQTQQRCESGSAVLLDANTCAGNANSGPPTTCGGTNPINILTGNKYQKETDYRDGVSGLNEALDIARTYQWSAEAKPQYGEWLFQGQSRIELQDTVSDYSDIGDGSACGFSPNLHHVYALKRSDHSEITFFGTINACGDAPDELIMSPAAGSTKQITLISPLDSAGNPTGAYTVKYPSGTVETFSPSASVSYLTQRQFVDGRFKQFIYDLSESDGGDGDPTTLDQVVGEDGRTLSYLHNTAGNLVATMDPSGRQYRYAYDDSGRLIHVSYPDSTPGAAGNNPFGEDNPFLTYHYEYSTYPTALTGITDLRGVRASTWTYDSRGRAYTSKHGYFADYVYIDYTYANRLSTDPRVTVTNPKGKRTTYHYSVFNGAHQVVQVEGHASAHCLAANKDNTYYPNGMLETKTDWKGNTTRFEYNEQNLEIRRVEAEGTPEERVISTQWHPTLDLRTKVTEPGRTVDYTYDENGRLLNSVSAQTLSN